MHLYNIASYGNMIRDSVRTDAYTRALSHCIGPESVVLDIGTGVGIWALLAAKMGARRVYAVEPNDAIHVARQFALANGCADRIEFIQDLTTRVTLPEKVDVIVTDVHGVLPMFEQGIVSVIDARRRLLGPRGRLIPAKETLWAVPVESVEAYDQIALPWGDNRNGLDMRPALRFAANQWVKIRGAVRETTYLARPECWATLEYAVVNDPNVRGEVTWTADRPGTAHGVVVWFDASLGEGVEFSNAPNTCPTIFGQAFFPWLEPVSISVGDELSMTIRADLIHDDYVWSWDTCVRGSSGAGRGKARFRQSTFAANPLSPDRIRRRASDHVPALGHDGQVELYVLSLTNGVNSLEQIARETASRFPERFVGWRDALTLVADVTERCRR